MSKVLYEVVNNIAKITLNNPKKRNMLDEETSSHLVDFIKAAEADQDVVAVLITGSGSYFCAGGQLSEIKPAKKKLKTIYSGFLSVVHCTLPTIVALNGPAIGAGFNMALACDVRIMSEEAVLDPKFFRLGLHPGGGCSWMLRRLCGWNVAASLLLFSQPLSAHEAVEKGLAWKSVTKEDLLEAAMAYTDAIRHLPKELLVRTKKTLLAADASCHINDILEMETQEQIWALQQPFAKKAIATVSEKIRNSNHVQDMTSERFP